MEEAPLKADTIRVKRASAHEFAERLIFCFWRLKQKIARKIWLIHIKHFETYPSFWEDDYSLDDTETQAIFEELDRDEQKYIEARPQIEPRQTVLIYAQENEHGCNFITTRKFEKYIFHLYTKAVSWGMTTFIVDFASPFGLLAYQMLLALREQGERFNLYIFQSKAANKCRSFRLIPETDIERIFMTREADYYYRCFFMKERQIDQFTKCAGVVFTERKIFVSPIHIPDYLLATWGVSTQ